MHEKIRVEEVPEDLSWSHFSSFKKTFFKVSAQNFHHHSMWHHWAYKISFCLSANHNSELRCVIGTGVTLFALVLHFLHWLLHLNCTALSQSESSNFFMYIINIEISRSNTKKPHVVYSSPSYLLIQSFAVSALYLTEGYLFSFIGIGNPKGSSVVVRYQHDINNLRDMVKSTLQGYDL